MAALTHGRSRADRRVPANAPRVAGRDRHSARRWESPLGCVVRSRRSLEEGVLAARLSHLLPARVARTRRLRCRHRQRHGVPRATQRLAMGPAM